MISKIKLTTAALKANQYLRVAPSHANNHKEKFCRGYQDGKRFYSLDGFYMVADLIAIQPRTRKNQN